MSLQTITFVSFGAFDKDLLEKTAEAVAEEYHCAVNIRDEHIDLSEYFDASRRQYDGNKLINVVRTLTFPESDKTLAFFSVDLFVPILTFIFGQAYLGGNAGIVSMYRLDNKRYGIPANNKLLLGRVIKEANHELGHMLGLIHCKEPLCVMRSSTYVEDIDQKNSHLCAKCREKLRTE
jgi:archaemetzincin